MTTTEIIREVACLPPDDPRVSAIASVLRRENSDPEIVPLVELAKRLNYHPTWLRRIRVPEMCGVRIAGRRRYDVAAVLAYMKSAKCQEAISEIRLARMKNRKAEASKVSPIQTQKTKDVTHV